MFCVVSYLISHWNSAIPYPPLFQQPRTQEDETLKLPRRGSGRATAAPPLPLSRPAPRPAGCPVAQHPWRCQRRCDWNAEAKNKRCCAHCKKIVVSYAILKWFFEQLCWREELCRWVEGVDLGVIMTFVSARNLEHWVHLVNLVSCWPHFNFCCQLGRYSSMKWCYARFRDLSMWRQKSGVNSFEILIQAKFMLSPWSFVDQQTWRLVAFRNSVGSTIGPTSRKLFPLL